MAVIRDALRFVVRQTGAGFCHRGTWTCFGDAEGLTALESTVQARRHGAAGDPGTTPPARACRWRD